MDTFFLAGPGGCSQYGNPQHPRCGLDPGQPHGIFVITTFH